MAMDGLNLAASVAECRRIVGGRIDKIQQPEKDELAVSLRCGGEKPQAAHKRIAGALQNAAHECQKRKTQ